MENDNVTKFAKMAMVALDHKITQDQESKGWAFDPGDWISGRMLDAVLEDAGFKDKQERTELITWWRANRRDMTKRHTRQL